MDHQARLDYSRETPNLFKKMFELSTAVSASPDLDAKLSHLVDIRGSQINGCACCLDMHVKGAKLHQERELRLHHIAIWRESPLFTAKERAALAWTEVLTRMGPLGVPDDMYEEALEHFSKKELSTLTFRVLTINAWNRVNVAFRTVPGSKDTLLGLDKAGLR